MSNHITHVMNLAWTEASIIATPELRQNRLGMILENPRMCRRTGALAMHAFVCLASNKILSTLSKPYERINMPVVGSGHNSTVIAHGSKIMKIVRNTETMPARHRQQVAARLEALIAVNAEYHPGLTLPSSVEEVEHPLTHRPVVAIIQERVYGSDALTLPRAPHALRSQLADFAERSLDVMVPLGFAPDVVGARNMLMQNDTPVLVDTVALQNLNRPNTAFPLSVQILRNLASTRR